jgi:deoxyribose-phosphate aldolase
MATMSALQAAHRPRTREELAARLDYANLAVDAREDDIRLLCLEAEKYSLLNICVNPTNVALAARCLAGSSVKVSAAIAYPIGAYPPEIKGFEIEDAIANGANEIMMMMAIGVFVEGQHDQTKAEMEMLVRTARGRPTRLMIEGGALTDEQKECVCHLAISAGIGYLVTSTDFAPGGFPGAAAADVAWLVQVAEDRIGIVAASNIRDTERALAMLDAGASRILTPAALDVLAGFE